MLNKLSFSDETFRNQITALMENPLEIEYLFDSREIGY
jgi:hypothetical protein